MSQGGPHTLKAQCPSLRTEEVIHAPIRGMFLLPDSRARIKNQTRRPLFAFFSVDKGSFSVASSKAEKSRESISHSHGIEQRSLCRIFFLLLLGSEEIENDYGSRSRFAGFFSGETGIFGARVLVIEWLLSVVRFVVDVFVGNARYCVKRPDSAQISEFDYRITFSRYL